MTDSGPTRLMGGKNGRACMPAAIVMALALLGAAPAASPDTGNESPEPPRTAEPGSRLSDQPLPLQVEKVPDRPALLLELGEPFLGTGPLGREFQLPTGAVWRPALWLFGTYRTAIQTFDNDTTALRTPDYQGTPITEWSHRVDLFANLKLSATERFLIGLRPVDRGIEFTRLSFQPQSEFTTSFNSVVRTLFLEGDFGEIFPNLDVEDRRMLDFGFSVGRQPMLFQDGFLIDSGQICHPDAVTLVRNNLPLPGASNLRAALVYAWGNNFRDNNRYDPYARFYGFFTEADFALTTVDVDFVWLESKATGNAFHAGIRGVQRLGPFNTTFALNTSHPLERETPATGRGTLLFQETSWTPPHTDNVLYLTTFWAIEEFASAFRGPDMGGSLGRAGILFQAQQLDRYRGALDSQAHNVVGGSLGYQMFFDGTRRQLILELGGRRNTKRTDGAAGADELAAGLRFQQAFGRHFVAQVDTFSTLREGRNLAYGARFEWRTQF